LYGLSPAEAVGQEFFLIFPPAERAAALERYCAIFTAPDIPASVAARVQDAEGRERDVEVRANFIVRDGERIAMISAIRDVTERQALEAAREAFVDAAAHDLRNPLTTLKGQAQILRRRLRKSGDIDIDAVIARLDAIDSAANHMARLLDEMLDASALQAGRTLELRQDHTDLIVQTEVAVEEAQRRTSRHVIRIESAVPALVGVWDEARLSRVLGNLLDNAVKYSPDGGEIEVRIWQEAEAADWVALSVSDPGVGIPHDDLPQLFERFHRGHNVRNIRGTGIGLSGVKRIVEQHGGTIEVASIEGEGSTFTVRLPLQP
jgi:PAS domain S-box-containing protein